MPGLPNADCNYFYFTDPLPKILSSQFSNDSISPQTKMVTGGGQLRIRFYASTLLLHIPNNTQQGVFIILQTGAREILTGHLIYSSVDREARAEKLYLHYTLIHFGIYFSIYHTAGLRPNLFRDTI